jgi:hypothetical protein
MKLFMNSSKTRWRILEAVAEEAVEKNPLLF